MYTPIYVYMWMYTYIYACVSECVRARAQTHEDALLVVIN